MVSIVEMNDSSAPIIDQILKIAADEVLINERRLNPNDSVKSLMDSLDCIEYVIALETAFNIQFSDQEADSVTDATTFVDVAAAVEKKVAELKAEPPVTTSASSDPEHPANIVISMAEQIEKTRVGCGIAWRDAFDKTYAEFPDRLIIAKGRAAHPDACEEVVLINPSGIRDGMITISARLTHWAFVA